MSSPGSFVVARLRGIPIRLHWTLPLSALLVGRLRFAPGAWLGLLLVVLVHELGHAALVRRYGFEVEAVELLAWGGECRFTGRPTRWQESVIAWGGVLAQALLLPVGYFLAPRIPNEFAAEVLASFGHSSLLLIAMNLCPVPPLDGSRAWRLVGMAWRRIREAKRRREVARRGAILARQRAAAIRAESDLEQRERSPSGTRLRGEVEEQVRRAVQRAIDEHEPRR